MQVCMYVHDLVFPDFFLVIWKTWISFRKLGLFMKDFTVLRDEPKYGQVKLLVR